MHSLQRQRRLARASPDPIYVQFGEARPALMPRAMRGSPRGRDAALFTTNFTKAWPSDVRSDTYLAPISCVPRPDHKTKSTKLIAIPRQCGGSHRELVGNVGDPSRTLDRQKPQDGELRVGHLRRHVAKGRQGNGRDAAMDSLDRLDDLVEVRIFITSVLSRQGRARFNGSSNRRCNLTALICRRLFHYPCREPRKREQNRGHTGVHLLFTVGCLRDRRPHLWSGGALGGLDVPRVWGGDLGTRGISKGAPLLWGRFGGHLRVDSARLHVDDEPRLSHAGTFCKIHRLNGDWHRPPRIASCHSSERRPSSFDHGTFLLGNDGVCRANLRLTTRWGLTMLAIAAVYGVEAAMSGGPIVRTVCDWIAPLLACLASRPLGRTNVGRSQHTHFDQR